MAAAIPIEYKIEKNVPITRSGSRHFDDTMPEYQIMMKLKVGDSFEFPKARVNFVHNCRVHLRKTGSPLSFTTTTPQTFRNNPKLLSGRCWRIKDGTFVVRGPKKNRPKGAAIDLSEKKNK